MALTQTQQTALEAAILAYVTAQGERLARSTAAFLEEAQFRGGKTVQTGVGGAVLKKAWAPREETGLEAAILAYLMAQGERYARTAAAFTEEAQQRNQEGSSTGSSGGGGAALVEVWASCVGDRDFNAESLRVAISQGKLEEVQLFVYMGIDVGALWIYDSPPLSYAVLSNRLEIVKYFVVLGFDKEQRDNMNGATPLTEACSGGHVEIVEYLLDQGCDVDRPDNFGWTALHYISGDGQLGVAKRLDVAQVLFRYGAKLDARMYGGGNILTPADFAIEHNCPEMYDAIRTEELRRRDHGFKRDPSTIEGTEEHAAAKRPRAEREAEEAAAAAAAAADESDDDDDDDDDEEEEDFVAGKGTK